MLRSAQGILGYDLLATDGKIGRVHDLYFDDIAWTVRYLVADTGTWLPGRLVLISPVDIGEPDWTKQALPVAYPKQRIEDGPSADLDKPVSRQHECELGKYYGWPVYWPRQQIAAESSTGGKDSPEGSVTEDGDPRLRSVKEVRRYSIQATDGAIGHVEDFVVETETWILRHVVVDTRTWLPGRKVLVEPRWIQSVRWAERNVDVDLTRKEIEGSPHFDPSQPVNRRYETRLYDYYGRPAYWQS